MEQHEKEILEKIRQHSEDIEIPESLKPEAIERKLNEKKYRKRRKVYTSVLAVASCAAVLGITVLYGGMHWGEMQLSRTHRKNLVAEEVRKSPKLKTAKSFDDIYAYVGYRERYGSGFFETSIDEKKEMAAPESAKGNSALADGASYSKTNTRETEVDEADIVKTDGRYIYTVTEEMNTVGIADTKDTKLKEVTEIEIDDCGFIQEIYVQDDRLIVLYSSIGEEVKAGTAEEFPSNVIAEVMPWVPGNMKTAVYDISDVRTPKLLQNFEQSGDYSTSRLNGEYLYVFSNYYVDAGCKKENPEEYMPYVEGQMVPVGKIILPETDCASMYTLVTSINIKSPDEIIDSVAILSDGGECYVSPENIYICDRNYSGQEAKTNIRKISYKDGKMNGEAKTEVLGYLNDSFSIDEYNGYLRMVVTLDRENTNSVYVLNENLKLTGKIEDLAEDERVYSARFMGDTGYFVTFRETDPLFTVDLSDPKNPEIIGSLKIPGFSEYLHPYGDGLLLGIGKEVDGNGVTVDEVKLSMFDISDPSNVKEIDKCIVENVYDSPAFYSYKSVTIDAGKNLIGFSAYAENEKYYLYEYDEEDGFTCNMAEGISRGGQETRGIYIGDVFYLIQGSRIESYNLQTFEKIDDLIL